MTSLLKIENICKSRRNLRQRKEFWIELTSSHHVQHQGRKLSWLIVSVSFTCPPESILELCRGK